ncbi:MAG: NAD kinase [Bacteroidia bacterium]|nr:NAD kinase [Bacteroidia bacterium]
MKIAVYGRMIDNNRTTPVQELFDLLGKEKVEVLIHEPFMNFIKDRLRLPDQLQTFLSHDDLRNRADFLFSLGGDGTLLETLSLVRDSGLPVVGINTGKLGFLSSIGKEESALVIAALREKKYEIEKKEVLFLDTPGLFSDLPYALNEITIMKNDTSSMVTIHAYLDDVLLNTYWCDGLIISTQTGSTAYSLSCGGPIVAPGADVFTLTPMAPHNLNVRPVVIPDHGTLRLKVEGSNKQYMLALDSRSSSLNNQDELTIRKAAWRMNLVRLPGRDFFTSLRNKLLWGIDKRG